MKELAKKYAICVAHLDTHSRNCEEPVIHIHAVAYLKCLCTTAIAESIAHFFTFQLGLILMMQKVCATHKL